MVPVVRILKILLPKIIAANCHSPRTPVTPVPDVTIETDVHGAVWYKYMRSVRIHINRLVSERYFAIWSPFGEVISRGSDCNHKYSQT